MTVKITLTTAQSDAGPFDLYSNIDNYQTPFETGVTKFALTAGYTSTVVPDYAAYVRVKCTGLCTNYIDIPLLKRVFPFSLYYDLSPELSCALGGTTVLIL